MKITFESDLLLPPISEAITILTDRAKVCVDDIRYDEAKGIVYIPMQRKELLGFKNTFLGEVQPVYRETMTEALLTIKQVKEMKIQVDDRLVADCHSCFTVLFGLKVDGKQLYLGSAEEMQGITLCQIFIKVGEMNIELGDKVTR